MVERITTFASDTNKSNFCKRARGTSIKKGIKICSFHINKKCFFFLSFLYFFLLKKYGPFEILFPDAAAAAVNIFSISSIQSS